MKKILLSIITFVCSIVAYAQQQESIQRLSIKSPEVAAFERMAEIPVDKYSGIPKISIPIYEVRSGDISLPISLDYHATAVKVNQEATWVGLNWLLNAGGVVTTQSVGPTGDAPIDKWRKVYQELITYSIPNGDPALGQSYKLDGSHELGYVGRLGRNRFPGIPDFTDDIAKEVYRRLLVYNEGQAQLYCANFAGHTLKFVYNKLDGTFIAVGQDKKYKIVGGDNYISEIVAPDGTKYGFSMKETITPMVSGDPTFLQRSVSYLLTSITSPSGRQITLSYKKYGKIMSLPNVSENIFWNCPGYTNSYIDRKSSPLLDINNYYLYEIKSDDATVRFDVGTRIDIKGDARRLETISVIRTNDSKLIKRFKLGYDYFTSTSIGGNALYDAHKKHGSLSTYNTYYNDNIINKRLQLLSVQEEVVNASNVTEKLPAYTFTYSGSLPGKSSAARDYWGNYNGKENSGTYYDHTLLVKPSATGEDSYNASPFTTQVTFADNRFNPSTVTNGMLSSIKYPTGGSTFFTYEPHSFTNLKYFDTTTTAAESSLFTRATTVTASNLGDRQFTLSAAQTVRFDITFGNVPSMYPWIEMPRAGSIVQLFSVVTTQTTGGPPVGSMTPYKIWTIQPADTLGKTSITYTTNLALPAGRYIVRPTMGNLPAYVPGVPFSERYISVGANVKTDAVASSNYGVGVRIKEIRQSDGNNNYTTTKYTYEKASGASSGILMSPLKFARRKMMIYQPGGSGTSIPIPQTIYYWMAGSDNMVPNEPKVGYSAVTETSVPGKTVYEYWNNRLTTTSSFDFYKTEDDPRNGSLLKQSTYNTSGGLVKEVENTYSVLKAQPYFINAVVEDIYSGPDDDGGVYPFRNLYQEAMQGGRMISYLYPSMKYWVELASRKETDYTTSGSVSTYYMYTYNPDNLSVNSIRKSTTGSSDNETTYFIYPHDYTAATGVYPNTLISKNILNKPLEVVSIRTEGTTSTIKSGSINKYDDYGRITSQFQLEQTSPTTLANFRFSNKTSSGVLGTTTTYKGGYSPFSTYGKLYDCQYSSAGNPVMITKRDNERVVYVWSYSKQYPVAQIENATYEQVRTALGYTTDGQMATMESSVTPDVNWIRGLLTTYFSSRKGLVTTYQYDPLKGVTKITAPNGMVTTYEYDTFSRLSLIKDNNGKTIQGFTYNYKQ